MPLFLKYPDFVKPNPEAANVLQIFKVTNSSGHNIRFTVSAKIQLKHNFRMMLDNNII